MTKLGQVPHNTAMLLVTRMRSNKEFMIWAVDIR
jgi:hypothetical protein